MNRVKAMPAQRNVIMAFTADQIAQLSGITVDRLRYWEKTEAFIAEHVRKILPGPFSRIYSFQDLVNLRVMADLRKNHGIDLQHLRGISHYIANYPDYPWSSLALRVYGTHLEFRDPATQRWMAADPLGQYTMELEFESVSRQAEQDARDAMRRGMDQQGVIVRNRNVMSNQFVFAGTRIPVSTVLHLLNAGYERHDILRCYPTLSDQDILAAIIHRDTEAAIA